MVLAAASWVRRGGKSAHPDIGLRAVQVPAHLLSAGTVTAEEIYLQTGKAVTVGLKNVLFIHETPGRAQDSSVKLLCVGKEAGQVLRVLSTGRAAVDHSPRGDRKKLTR